MTTKKDLPTMLQGWADAVRRSTCDLANPYALVLELGRAFAPQPKPRGIRWGKKKRCYDNAFDLLGQHPTLVYCEGFVLAGPALFPVEHAWCVDEAGNVVDNTLREVGIGYFSIPFDSKWVVRKVGSGADSLVDQLLLSKKIPKTAIAKPYRR
jgi:hypothetical protein